MPTAPRILADSPRRRTTRFIQRGRPEAGAELAMTAKAIRLFWRLA